MPWLAPHTDADLAYAGISISSSLANTVSMELLVSGRNKIASSQVLTTDFYHMTVTTDISQKDRIVELLKERGVMR